MSDVNNLTEQALKLEQAGVMSQGIGTAMGGVGSLATGIVGLVGSGQAIRDAESNLQAVKDAAPSLTTPTAYMDAVKNAYDQRLMTMRNEDINRALSSSVSAAGQYGARGLGMAMQAQNQAQANLRAEAEAQQKAQTAALTNLGAAQQNAQQMQEARYQSDLDLAYDERKAAQARQQQAIQGITQGVMGLATGGPQLYWQTPHLKKEVRFRRLLASSLTTETRCISWMATESLSVSLSLVVSTWCLPLMPKL